MRNDELDKWIQLQQRRRYWLKVGWGFFTGVLAVIIVLLILTMTGCAGPRVDANNNGIDDAEDTAWQWSGVLAGLIPGVGGIVSGGLAAAYKWREASANKKALQVATDSLEEEANLKPEQERVKFTQRMKEKQESAGVRHTIQKARGKV
jgi:hypothetical protein